MAKRTVVIVGAGLSGLWAASLLHTSGVPTIILEARDRIGGRVLSVVNPASDGTSSDRFDLGGSWIWSEQQPHIRDLIRKLESATFPQYSSGAMLVERFRLERASSYAPQIGERPLAFRLTGGVQSLVEKIEATLPKHSIRLHADVKQIVHRPSTNILLRVANSEDVYADTVILALPPRLIARNIVFDPPLSLCSSRGGC